VPPYLSIYLSICPWYDTHSAALSIYLSIYLSMVYTHATALSIYLSLYLWYDAHSAALSIYLSTLFLNLKPRALTHFACMQAYYLYFILMYHYS